MLLPTNIVCHWLSKRRIHSIVGRGPIGNWLGSRKIKRGWGPLATLRANAGIEGKVRARPWISLGGGRPPRWGKLDLGVGVTLDRSSPVSALMTESLERPNRVVGRRPKRPHRRLISLQVDVVGHALVNELNDRRRRILADGRVVRTRDAAIHGLLQALVPGRRDVGPETAASRPPFCGEQSLSCASLRAERQD